MSTAVMQQSGIMRAGTCPHGAPLGACPICNGMGGGGMRKADHTAKPGEMSWNECAAIGAMLKAQQAAKVQSKQDAITFTQKMIAFEKSISNVQQRIADISNTISKSFPKIISAPVNFVLNKVIGGVLNLVKNIPAVIQNITQKFADISDKLAAVYGEIKAAISKKIGEPLNELRKKIKSLFSIFDTQDTKNDDKQIDETKKAFKLKTFIHDLYSKLKGEDSLKSEQEGIK